MKPPTALQGGVLELELWAAGSVVDHLDAQHSAVAKFEVQAEPGSGVLDRVACEFTDHQHGRVHERR